MVFTHHNAQPSSLRLRTPFTPKSTSAPARPALQVQQQRSLGNQAWQQMHASGRQSAAHVSQPSNLTAMKGPVSQSIHRMSEGTPSQTIIQRDEQAAAPPGTSTSPTESPEEGSVPSPDVNVESVDIENDQQLNTTLGSSPQLVQDLLARDPTRFNFALSPISPATTFGPLAPISPTSASRFFPAIPSTLQSSPTSTPSVPSEFSLWSHGPFHFRLVFEEPSLNISESLRESEQRFSQFINPPSSELDTGKLIKGLITNFLTQTPPGQAILQGITGAFGGSGEPGETGPTLNLNLDVLPSPVLQGQPPTIMLNVQGTF
ncbi:MAG: hypothetical protein OEY91_13390 [Nitrospirota bacterium]|nr:hypothetical protein [Nitrospirota bacterium]